MRRPPILLLALCLLAFPLSVSFAQQLVVKGRLLDKQKGAPIPAATVAVIETDAMTESDKDGRFTIELPGPGTYTVVVSAEGFEEYKEPRQFPVDGELVITLSKLTFSMDIKVVEPRQKTTQTETITREEIENTPTGGDAFEAINRESDVVKEEGGILDRDFGAARMALATALGFGPFSLIAPFSYRSLPDYSNAYYLDDFIPLPFINYPSISSAFSTSIFPQVVVKAINLYGGGIEPSMGPGAGLIVSADISTPPSPQKIAWTWQVSLLGADAQAIFPLFGSSVLEVSLRKSYYEYTWLPLVFLLDRELGWRLFYDPFGPDLNTDITVGSGDVLLRYSGRLNDKNWLVVDVVTCLSYTDFNMDRVNLSGDGGDHTIANMNDFYLLNAAGASWTWKPSSVFSSTFQGFDSLYTMTSDSGTRYFSGEFYDESSSYPYNIAGGKETVTLSITKDLESRIGLEFRNIYGSFHHQVDVSEYSFMPWEPKDLRGQALFEYEASGWADADWDLPPFRLKPSLRVDWFSKAMGDTLDLSDFKPSPLLTAIWYPSDKTELDLSVGQRCDRFDYFNWILFNAAQGQEMQGFWITGDRTVIDEKYLMKSPARLSAVQGVFRYETPGVRLGLLGYGYYMDQMSGFNFQSFKMSEQSILYSDAGGSAAVSQDTGFKDADLMYSAGATAKSTFTWGPVELTINYTFGYSRIHLKESDTWTVPNSDITNYLKVFFHFPLGPRWFWDLNTNIACGIPATPSRLLAYDPTVPADSLLLSQVSWQSVQDQYNQMRDWMPRVTVNFSTEYRWDNGLILFIDVANLLSFVHYDGPNPDRVAVGDVEQSWLDRRYKVFSISMDYVLNVKVDFGLKYRPK